MSVKLDRLLKSVDGVLAVNAGVRVDGKVASLRTQGLSKEVMYTVCRNLHKMGFMIEDIKLINEKHIGAVIKSWHEEGKSNKTLQNQYSRLKIFVNQWLGKSGLVKDGGLSVYLKDVDPASLKVQTYTDKSKSWSGNGLDIEEAVRKAREEDERFGAMVLMGLAFGLRKKEMLRIKPWSADRKDFLEIDGAVAKNGRYRAISMDGAYGQFQRQVLDSIKKIVKRGETLGWTERTYDQNEGRYHRLMARIGATKIVSGVTGHGLRAEYSENQALLMGLIPPSLGGDKKQMSKLDREEITLRVSNKMGHARVSVLGAYYGTFRKVQVRDGSIGERAGTFLLSMDGDDFGHVHCNPSVNPSAEGKYRELTEKEKAEIQVTVVLEGPSIAGGSRKVAIGEVGSDESMDEKAHARLGKLLERIGF